MTCETCRELLSGDIAALAPEIRTDALRHALACPGCYAWAKSTPPLDPYDVEQQRIDECVDMDISHGYWPEIIKCENSRHSPECTGECNE